ncbi:MAG TPA: hypothetical protein PKA82_11145 [Pyrinomonadaceae bacterium]|nr:hypothetical protein [Pyrinomonadaceae bacterium]
MEKPKVETPVPGAPHYIYRFERPGFLTSLMHLEHDASGKGKITFLRDGNSEEITEAVRLPKAVVEKIDTIYTTLTYLDSTENYQYEHDRSNMGNHTFTLSRDGRSRTVKFNWTTNEDAKSLMNLYRGIGYEMVWKFEVELARENQPLETPTLMNEMEGYLRRDEIADPPSLLPYLKQITIDERFPLMARNRAEYMIKTIEKAVEKKK